MMDLNKSNIKKILGIIVFAVLVLVGAQNISGVITVLRALLLLLSPFIFGLCIAFILNVPMRFLERIIFRGERIPHSWKERIRRPVSILLTFILVAGIIFVVMFIIIPELGRTIKSFANSVPDFLVRLQGWAQQTLGENPQLNQFFETLEIDWSKIGETAVAFFESGIVGSVVSSTVNMASSILRGIVNFGLGLVFSVYILMQKENLGRQVRRTIYALFPEKWSDRAIRVGMLSNQTFSKFLSGQCIEAVILGLLFFLSMTILRFPYAITISVLITLTALIPIFGAIIGCVVGALLILMVSPLQSLWFLILFIVLQQVEGNLIYPHVVGTSVGLPSLWVLAAVTIGGALMGISGMLLFIPLCSVIYTLLREFVWKRLGERKIAREKID